MRRFVTVMTVVLASGLLTACDGDSTGNGDDSIFGTYTLQTVNGSSLPFVIAQVGNDKSEITGGSVRLNTDNTYSLSIIIRLTEAGTVTTATEGGAGTFTATGTNIQFGDIDGTGVTGSISGNTLTIMIGPFTFVLQKS